MECRIVSNKTTGAKIILTSTKRWIVETSHLKLTVVVATTVTLVVTAVLAAMEVMRIMAIMVVVVVVLVVMVVTQAPSEITEAVRIQDIFPITGTILGVQAR